MLTVMKMGASVSPCLFVQAEVRLSAARRATAKRALVFIQILPLRPKDSGSDKDEQLVVLLGPRLVPEEIPEDRNLPQTRDHVVLILVVDLEDAADHRRSTVLHQDLSAILADRQRNVLADRQVEGHGRLTLADVDRQEDRALGRDLMR